MTPHPLASRPIGVFDSGVGGLSVLAALLKELPQEQFVYFSDALHAPYGERDDAFIIARSRDIGRMLIQTKGIKALVVACNTATAAAIALLRQDWPNFPLIGVEPALKPAAAMTKTHHVGVLATRTTLLSSKFQSLHQGLIGKAQFHLVACDGLASAIERNDINQITDLSKRYIDELGPLGNLEGQIDTLVLGCTHYPFAAPTLRRLTNPVVRFLDTGTAVAQHTRRLLAQRQQLREGQCQFTLEGSGDPQQLQAAAVRLLGSQWLELQTVLN